MIRSLYRGCRGKVAFPSRDKAVGRASALVRKGRAEHATAYHCPHCGHWHLSLRQRPRGRSMPMPE